MSICTCVRMNAVCVCDPCVSIVYTCMRVHEERRKREREVRGGEGRKEGRAINTGTSVYFASFSPLFFFPAVLRSALFLPSFLDRYIYICTHKILCICARANCETIDCSKNFTSIILRGEFFLFSNILFFFFFLTI